MRSGLVVTFTFSAAFLGYWHNSLSFIALFWDIQWRITREGERRGIKKMLEEVGDLVCSLSLAQ